jgi:hypothetical protein
LVRAPGLVVRPARARKGEDFAGLVKGYAEYWPIWGEPQLNSYG